MNFSLPKLAFQSLTPIITDEMLDVHYNGHHATYINNLNHLLANNNIENVVDVSPDIFLKQIDTLSLSEDIKTKIKFNYGGYWNHTFFWEILTKPHDKCTNISPEFLEVICNNFTSFEMFCDTFKSAALGIMGSGWCWLCADKKHPKSLTIITTENQNLIHEMHSHNDEHFIPLLTLDMWEHAYYLKFKNKKADFIDAFWSIVNWEVVGEKYFEMQ